MCQLCQGYCSSKQILLSIKFQSRVSSGLTLMLHLNEQLSVVQNEFVDRRIETSDLMLFPIFFVFDTE